jgi:hypothetical protein
MPPGLDGVSAAPIEPRLSPNMAPLELHPEALRRHQSLAGRETACNGFIRHLDGLVGYVSGHDHRADGAMPRRMSREHGFDERGNCHAGSIQCALRRIRSPPSHGTATAHGRAVPELTLRFVRYH